MPTTIISIKSSLQSPYPLEVVGESRYKSNLLKICGDYDQEEGYDDATQAAELILEDNNPYDPGNTVVVKIDDLTVGYLAKPNALAYRQRLAQLGLSGDVLGICTASIKGGFEKDGDITDFGVRLDVSLPDFEIEHQKQVTPLIPTAVKANPIPRPKRKSTTYKWLIPLGIVSILVVSCCCCIIAFSIYGNYIGK